MSRVAAIDCGTNSIRLLVADVTTSSDGKLELRDVHRESRVVRLGKGVDANGVLDPEALERTRAALGDYTAILRREGAERVRMVATSATRDARNREDFFGMVRETLGAEAEVISGDEEANLSFAGAVGDLDPVEELHRFQVRDQLALGPRLGVHPHRRAVVDQIEGVLDVPVGGEDQGFGRLVRREVADVLGEQQVQPGQPVVAGDRDDPAVRQVDETAAVGECALFTEQVAVVRGDAFVAPLGGDGAGQGQQGALHATRVRLGRPALPRAAGSFRRAGLGRLRRAVGAAPEDREVLHVGLEAERAPQLRGEVGDHVHVGLDDVRAVPADEVDVVMAVRQVVRRGAVPEVGMADQPELLQELQGPVDGGDVHARRRPAHLAEDVVGRRVLQLVHGLQNELALRRQPVATLPKIGLPVGAHHMPSVGRSEPRPAGPGRATGLAGPT